MWARRIHLALAAITLTGIVLLVLTGAVVLVPRQHTTLVSPPVAIAPSAALRQQTSAIYSTSIYDHAAPIYAAPVLGVVVDQQLRIVAVAAGSAADQAGLQPGDIITRLNDATISSAAAGTQLIQQARAGQQIMLTVDRNGQALVVPVQLAAPHSQPGQATPTPIPGGLDYF